MGMMNSWETGRRLNQKPRRKRKKERKAELQREVYSRRYAKWEAREPKRWRLLAHWLWKQDEPKRKEGNK